MPTIILKFNENVIGEYILEQNSSLTVGRRNTNDIMIENLAVSGHHAKIESVGDGYLFTDLKSKNGSFVNEQFVLTHYLSHGDMITIGKHTLVFQYAEEEKRAKDDMLIAVLSFMSGGEEDVDLTKKITKIGKGPSCDIVVNGLLVGKYAAMISKRDKGYYISHVDGFIKPKVNNMPVKNESVKLEEFDTIQIGSARMKFAYKK